MEDTHHNTLNILQLNLNITEGLKRKLFRKSLEFHHTDSLRLELAITCSKRPQENDLWISDF